eukprot:2493213-Lingulodinium_polyedra.AAC.1
MWRKEATARLMRATATTPPALRPLASMREGAATAFQPSWRQRSSMALVPSGPTWVSRKPMMPAAPGGERRTP